MRGILFQEPIVACTSVVGLQWGDEAKGKIVDLLTDEHDLVVRYQGGNNAGHTVVSNGEVYKFSLIPTGILRPSVQCVIAAGVVVHPPALLNEIDDLEARGVTVGGKLLVSDRAHVIFPYHLEEERIMEARRGGDAIGTTMRGIGPCYRDKAGRTHGLRIGDLFHERSFRRRLAEIVRDKNQWLDAMQPAPTDGRPTQAAPATHRPAAPPFDAEHIADEYLGYAERLRPFVTDTTRHLHEALDAGKRLLFEGAQGSLLDLDHGTYPFVTSSNSSGCGLAPGSGVPARAVDRTIGVVKAYTTRVGGGPFPTELHDEIGQKIRDTGREYGTVTGRPRRCGWFDAVAARYAARISGADCLAVMLLDVLSELTEIKVCEAYRLHGSTTACFPSHIDDLASAEPVYRTLPGWCRDVSTVRKLGDLPKQARAYLDTICELLAAPLKIVSVGRDREQTIWA